MKNNDKIRDEKLHYDIDSDAAKLSALSSGKFININMLLVKKYYFLIKNK